MEFREGHTVPRDCVPGVDEHFSGKTVHDFLQVLKGMRVLTSALGNELFCDRPVWAPFPSTCLTLVNSSSQDAVPMPWFFRG